MEEVFFVLIKKKKQSSYYVTPLYKKVRGMGMEERILTYICLNYKKWKLGHEKMFLNIYIKFLINLTA